MPIPSEAPPLPDIDPDQISGTYAVMCLLRAFAETFKDPETHIDSGFGFDRGDFQVTRKGVEYNVQISICEPLLPLTPEEQAEDDAYWEANERRVAESYKV